MGSPQKQKRGRPLKFGRSSQVVMVTLPDDTVSWLSTIDRDLGWAIVKLHQQATRRRRVELAGLFQIPGGRALILVQPAHFDGLDGVSLIPLSDGRAFLALDPKKGVADLELAVLDRLDGAKFTPAKRAALMQLRELLQGWRRDGIEFESRSIIVARREQKRSRPRSRPLASLQPARSGK